MFVWSVPLQSSRTASSLQAESLPKILVNTYIATYTASCLKRLRTSTIIRRRIKHNILHFVWSLPLQSSRTASSLQAASLPKILVNTYIATYTASCLKRLRTSTIIRRRINHNILHFVWSLPLQSSRTASSLQAESLPKILVNTYISTYTASCLKRLENFNNNQKSDKAQYIAFFSAAFSDIQK